MSEQTHVSEQSYPNHRRYVPGFHFVLGGLLALTLVGSLVHLVAAVFGGRASLASLLVFALTVCAALLFWYCRVFALKAQDRAIRAEENLRHYLLTGAPLDPRIGTRQVVGLRFASDAELPELARRAAEEGLSQDAIKQAIRTWRPDNYRV